MTTRKQGRPPRIPDHPLTEQLSVRVSPRMMARLELQATLTDVTIADHARSLLSAALDRVEEGVDLR